MYDEILWYAKDKEKFKYCRSGFEKRAGEKGGSLYTQVRLADGTSRPLNKDEKAGADLPKGARVFGVDNLVSSSGVDKTRYPVKINGREYRPNPGVWKTSESAKCRL